MAHPVKVKWSDKDKGWRKLVRELNKSRPVAYTTVGIHKEEGGRPGSAGGLNILEIAIFNEFGVNRPERSFVRAVVDAKGKEIARQARILAGQVAVNALPLYNALDLLGHFVQKEMRARIVNREIPPPNAASTISKKGSSTPLVDTGILLGSITHRVVAPR